MKEYPTISKDPQHGFFYGFDKLDGSSIRAEWSRKSGFCKFGRRHGLLDGTNPILERAPDLIRAKYEKELADIFKKQRFDRVIAFFEFWGKNSFAGNHDINETQDVTLFDVSVDKKGILEPKEFVKVFSEVDTAKLLYKGSAWTDIRDQILEGTLPGMTFEGVVFKGSYVSPGRPMMFKVKSRAWIEKLKNFCGGNDKLFSELL